MGQAYTPGLEVTAHTTLERLRELPLPGTVLVKVGDQVEPQTPVLRAELPGEIEIVRVADRMGLDPESVLEGMKVKTGDTVKEGDLICEVKSFFGLFTSRLNSPSSGVVEYFTEGNAHLGLRGPSQPLEVNGYISGVVTAVDEGKSATIRTDGAIIQGIFGVGGERYGVIRCLNVAADAEVGADAIAAAGDLNGAILVGGACFTQEALAACGRAGVAGVMTGSVSSATLREYVGYEIGVSITGDEEVPFTLIISEGFGRLAISDRVLQLARALEGRSCSVNGATQVRAGAMRPELLVPAAVDDTARKKAAPSDGSLAVGSRIRIIRLPYFGRFAEVTELPFHPEEIPSGAVVRVLRAKLDPGGEIVTVPRANVELT